MPKPTDRDIETHSVADEHAVGGMGGTGVSDQERVKRKRIMERRSGEVLKRKWADEDRAAIEKRRQDSSPPAINVPTCHVCQSEYRDFIEESIAEGIPYVRIEERVGIDRRSIANHGAKHMEMARQAIADELMIEARALAQDVETSGTITDRGILRVMASKGFKDIINGVSSVEPKDLIAIIKLLNELNSNVANTRAEENEIALRTFVRAIETVCDMETIKLIVAEAERIKDLDDISFEMEGIVIRKEDSFPDEQKALPPATIEQ